MRSISRVFVGFIVPVALVATGCNNNNTSDRNTVGIYKFYYYPAKNVYYNVASKNYLYSLDGGKTWDSLKVTNNSKAEALGKRSEIESETPEVWKNNAGHIKSFGGAALILASYNINGELTAEDVVSERKIVTRQPISNRKVVEGQKEKKGIGKLINNIFGLIPGAANVTGNIAFTDVMGVISFVVITPCFAPLSVMLIRSAGNTGFLN
jgi:hypothetical protein